MSRLRDRYTSEVVPALRKEFGYTNVMAIPKLTKVVVNMGLGEATSNAKIVDVGGDELARITGQKPVTTRAKKSIAQFKVRQGQPIGSMVTLRGGRMYEFLDRLIAIALPRVRDFRGVSPKGFDGRGNYTLGLQRSADLHGDRLPQGGQGSRHEHLGRHDGQDQRGGAPTAAAPRDALPGELGSDRRPEKNDEDHDALAARPLAGIGSWHR